MSKENENEMNASVQGRGDETPGTERGPVHRAGCDCSPGECWEIHCSDCGRVAEGYDDESAEDFVIHWPTLEDAFEECTADGFEWWDDEIGQPVLCGSCMDVRLAHAS